MEEALFCGLMAGSILVSMLMIKKKDMEFLNGLMGGSTKENGAMVNSMGKELIPLLMGNMKVFGMMGKKLVVCKSRNYIALEHSLTNVLMLCS